MSVALLACVLTPHTSLTVCVSEQWWWHVTILVAVGCPLEVEASATLSSVKGGVPKAMGRRSMSYVESGCAIEQWVCACVHACLQLTHHFFTGIWLMPSLMSHIFSKLLTQCANLFTDPHWPFSFYVARAWMCHSKGSDLQQGEPHLPSLACGGEEVWPDLPESSWCHFFWEGPSNCPWQVRQRYART